MKMIIGGGFYASWPYEEASQGGLEFEIFHMYSPVQWLVNIIKLSLDMANQHHLKTIAPIEQNLNAVPSTALIFFSLFSFFNFFC